MKAIETSTIIVALLAVLCQNALSQDVPRYRPSRPTVSPYLNLLRNDNGALPNYYGLVRPQLNQQAFDNQITATSRSQTLAIQKLSHISGNTVNGPTGSGSVFKNYSHFYPAKQR